MLHPNFNEADNFTVVFLNFKKYIMKNDKIKVLFHVAGHGLNKVSYRHLYIDTDNSFKIPIEVFDEN